MKFLPMLIVLLLVVVFADGAQAQRGRLMPPEALTCERNHLTSYEGRLQRLEIGDGWHRATVQTDWDSLESFELTFAGDEPYYLLNGQPMATGRWRELLPDPAHPPAGLRVIAWVCECPASVTLDWRPAETPVPPQADS